MAQTRIKGYTFTLLEPFAAGTVLTRGEAQALNDLRVENIANNLRKLVADEVAKLAPGALLPQETVDRLQSEITRYDRNYQFLEKHSPRPRLGDIEDEARAVARELVEVELRGSGQEADETELERLVVQKAEEPKVLEQARSRVAAKRAALSGGLDSL